MSKLRPLRLISLVALAGLLLASSASAGWWGKSDRIELTGDTVEQSYDLTDFDRVSLDTVVDCEIEQSDTYAVELELDEALVDLIDVRVRRGTLVIDIDEDVEWNDGDAVRILIRMPDLRELEMNGVGTVRGRDLDLEVLDLSVAGVGSVELSGRVTELSLEFEGVGNVDLSRLEATRADVDLEGVGSAEVYVTGELVARIEGLGNLRYHGDPAKVRPTVNGLGSIEAAD